MGEAKRRQLAVQTQALEAMVVDTPGGRIHVQWDHGASATPNAQLTFFAEFMATTGVYDSWVDSCPLSYTSPNAHSRRDVLGTWLLAILAGHNRYARRKRQTDGAHRQYPRGLESCQGCCGAVASDGSLEDFAGLRGGKNHPAFAALAPARSTHDGRVTAGFRVISPSMAWPCHVASSKTPRALNQ